MARALAKARFRMPAEWEPHDATWFGWPHNPEDWPGKFEPIPYVFAEIVRHLQDSERVHLVVEDAAAEKAARGILQRSGARLGRVRFFRVRTDRGWTRDFGPMMVLDHGRPTVLDWRFNAWAKYDNWKLDDAAAGKLAAMLKVPVVQPTFEGRRVVLEGGAIDVNGQGLMLTTEECLLGKVQERNPGMSREDYEQVFREYLGVQRVLWLGEGIAGDDTHGHIDDLARFVGPRTVVTVVEKDRADPNFERLADNLRRLKKMEDLSGRALEVVELPMPRRLEFEGVRLPASYANFYIGNSAVLMPTFNDPNDRVALGILAKLFPKKTVCGIHAVDLVWGFGTLHCLSQQQPSRQSR